MVEKKAKVRIPKSFLVGSAVHFVFWLAMNFPNGCSEKNCMMLIWANLPVSLLYFPFMFAGKFIPVIALSLIIGTVWWGVIFLVAAALYSSMRSRHRS
jgi:hypothetical protein